MRPAALASRPGVGSSAMISFGRSTTAAAISARRAMPPESSKGYIPSTSAPRPYRARTARLSARALSSRRSRRIWGPISIRGSR